MVVALIAAGGTSRRMGQDKLKLILDGQTVLEKTLLAFDSHSQVDKIILATDDAELVDLARKITHKELIIVSAGKERQYSVRNGLNEVSDKDIVLIHDAARPFVTHEVISRCIASAESFGSGVAAVPIYDSLKRADENMVVSETVDRTGMYAMQTPQGFLGAVIKEAHKQQALGTDDAYLVEQMGGQVKLVMGDKNNIKLTTPGDVPSSPMRIGHGYDVHKLVEGRRLILCGVEIPYEKGLLGHSDADVATHALMDAMLGAAGCYDIGRMFPDSDERYKGASSIMLLKEVKEHLLKQGYALSNCDVTIVAQHPKLLPYMDSMRESLSEALGCSLSQINVKATTSEGLGFEGEGLGISSTAVVILKGI